MNFTVCQLYGQDWISMFEIGIWLCGWWLCAIQPQAEEAMNILGASSDILIGMC